MFNLNRWLLSIVLFLFDGILNAESPCALEESEKITTAAKANDLSTPIRTLPDEYDDVSLIEKMKEADFAKMDGNDLRLKVGWVDLFTGLTQNGFPQNLNRDDPKLRDEAFQAAVFFDLRRRGDTATPVLLELAKELEDTVFESALLLNIEGLKGLNLEPFLDYSRNLIRKRPRSPSIFNAANFLIGVGNRDDVTLLESLAKVRPFYSETIMEKATSLKKRLDYEDGLTKRDGAARNNKPPNPSTVPNKKSLVSDLEKRDEIALNSSTTEPKSAKSRLVTGLIVAMAVGLLWWLHKNRK